MCPLDEGLAEARRGHGLAQLGKLFAGERALLALVEESADGFDGGLDFGPVGRLLGWGYFHTRTWRRCANWCGFLRDIAIAGNCPLFLLGLRAGEGLHETTRCPRDAGEQEPGSVADHGVLGDLRADLAVRIPSEPGPGVLDDALDSLGGTFERALLVGFTQDVGDAPADFLGGLGLGADRGTVEKPADAAYQDRVGEGLEAARDEAAGHGSNPFLGAQFAVLGPGLAELPADNLRRVGNKLASDLGGRGRAAGVEADDQRRDGVGNGLGHTDGQPAGGVLRVVQHVVERELAHGIRRGQGLTLTQRSVVVGLGLVIIREQPHPGVELAQVLQHAKAPTGIGAFQLLHEGRFHGPLDVAEAEAGHEPLGRCGELVLVEALCQEEAFLEERGPVLG